MGRRKGSLNKNKNVVDSEEKPEVIMSETQVLENTLSELDAARLELEKTKAEIEVKKAELKVTGSREHSKEEMAITEKQIAGFAKNNGLKEKIEAQKAYDDVMVTGKFINRRHPGKKSEKLTYQKYATDPVKWYDFEDGKIYTIPRGFVDQIRDHYYVPHFIQTTQAMDPNRPASAIHDVDTSQKKYDFVPINF